MTGSTICDAGFDARFDDDARLGAFACRCSHQVPVVRFAISCFASEPSGHSASAVTKRAGPGGPTLRHTDQEFEADINEHGLVFQARRAGLGKSPEQRQHCSRRMATMRQSPCDSRQGALICSATTRTGAARGGARKDKIMSNRRLFSALGDLFTTFGSAVAAARAVEAGRKPRADDLRKLGMDPAIFNRIGRF